MPAPRWFFRIMYDRESTSWGRRRDEPDDAALVDRDVEGLLEVVDPPGPIADLGCGPGAHALAAARRGYEVVGLDTSPGMVEVARDRAGRDGLDATFVVRDVGTRLPFEDDALGGVLAILVLQHLGEPEAFLSEVRRCLRPGGHVLLAAPVLDRRSSRSQGLYWRARATCFQLVPGLVRFYDEQRLAELVECAGLTLVSTQPGRRRVMALARA